MSVNKAFSEFIETLIISDTDGYIKKFNRISSKMHEKYWSKSDGEKGIIVGSVGRGTAISGISDLDMLYVLPNDVKTRLDKRTGNVQSVLLQEVKNQITLTYPRTSIKGDGQVVVVNFTNYDFEVCPVFIKDEDTFYYPDSKNGGKWKTTKPILEQNACSEIEKDFGDVFKYMCFLTRAWKNHWGLKIGGLLIDTLVYNFLKVNEEFKQCDYSDYPSLLNEYFRYLSELNEKQTFWLALGSNQKVYNKDKGKFIRKSKKIVKKLNNLDLNTDEVYEAMMFVFGNKFPNYSSVKKSLYEVVVASFRKTEEFIEDNFLVDIRHNLNIDCRVTQNGFQPFWIKEDKKPLKASKNLKFVIKYHDVPEPYSVYWKVKNCGNEAMKRDMIRGQIVKDLGTESRSEETRFSGEHYVECYIVKNNICVARDRIDVPISVI